MLLSSWAEHLRQFARMTKAETELVERVWAMHAGDEEPLVRHYLKANRLSTPLGFSQFGKRLAFRHTPEREESRGTAEGQPSDRRCAFSACSQSIVLFLRLVPIFRRYRPGLFLTL